jgi:hypothetical protein
MREWKFAARIAAVYAIMKCSSWEYLFANFIVIIDVISHISFTCNMMDMTHSYCQAMLHHFMLHNISTAEILSIVRE